MRLAASTSRNLSADCTLARVAGSYRCATPTSSLRLIVLKLALALVPFALGCTESPLVRSGPQVEVISNPGGVDGQPRFQLSLTTWVHLADLRDAAESGELEAMLDGEPLRLLPGATGSFGNGDRYTAAFGLASIENATARPRAAFARSASTVMVTDQRSTWSVTVPELWTNDLEPVGPMVSGQVSTVAWPSAATSEPWSTIDFACIAVEHHASACHGGDRSDPGIAMTGQYIEIDVPASSTDRFTLWGQRSLHPQPSGDGPVFLTKILGQMTGTFE